MRSKTAFGTAAMAIALAACGGRASDARNSTNNQPIGDTLAAKQPISSDTAVIQNPPSAQGDSSAKAHGGTGPTGSMQGGPTGTGPEGMRAATGDSTGKH